MLDRQQLVDTIAGGNDSYDNRLILKTNGEFEIIRYRDAQDALLFERLDYVTRWETFDAGNDYVGIEAANDKKCIDSLMDWAEQCWAKYNNTGRTKIISY